MDGGEETGPEKAYAELARLRGTWNLNGWGTQVS